MSGPPLSCAASQLLRSVVARTGLDPGRIIVGRFHTVDWQSLTFIGERHEISLQLSGPDPEAALNLLRTGLAEAEWALHGYLVADIVIVGERMSGDGTAMVDLEALTLTH